jgi:hypothetical protein
MAKQLFGCDFREFIKIEQQKSSQDSNVVTTGTSLQNFIRIRRNVLWVAVLACPLW